MNEREIFMGAIEITDPVQRSAYLKETCGGDKNLRGKVMELLKAHEQSSQFLETPAVAIYSAADDTSLRGASDTNDTPGADRASPEAEFRKYLEPATRPGWLGRLAHYEVEAILGAGAFGIVAKALDEKLHRVVAIKMLSPQLATTSPPRKRFLREARAAASVSQQNVVAVFAVEEEPIPYIVMEFVAGETLQQRMDRTGPLDVIDVVRIGRQIAEGLASAHAVNLIHRDIKPANILLTVEPSEQIKISDFGLARAVDDASMTASGFIAGTPLYMAPEQARGGTLDHRADLFSLGSVMYQMASGHPPFRAANAMAVLKRVCEHAPRPITDIIPTTPGWLCAVIERLMAKQPDSRFQTAGEVAELLARCEKELEQTGLVASVRIKPKIVPFRRKKSEESPQQGPWRVILAAVLLAVPLAIWKINEGRFRRSAETLGQTAVLEDSVQDKALASPLMIHKPENAPDSRPSGTPAASSGQVATSESDENLESARSETKPALTRANPAPSSPQPIGTVADTAPDEASDSAERGSSEASETDAQTPVAAADNDAAGEAINSESEGDVEADWVELFNGQTLEGWQSTDTNRKAWRVEDGTIVVSGLGRGYLHRDFVAKHFEVSLEYRTLQHLDFGPFTRAPDQQLGRKNAVEFTLIDFASLAATRLSQDGGIGLPASSDEFTPLMQQVGGWNQVRLRIQGLSNELWFNGQLIVKQDHTRRFQIVPHHTAYTREAVRVVLQHWGPERVEFRNIRVRELPPPDSQYAPRIPSQGNQGSGGGRGFGGRSFGGGRKTN